MPLRVAAFLPLLRVPVCTYPRATFRSTVAGVTRGFGALLGVTESIATEPFSCSDGRFKTLAETGRRNACGERRAALPVFVPLCVGKPRLRGALLPPPGFLHRYGAPTICLLSCMSLQLWDNVREPSPPHAAPRSAPPCTVYACRVTCTAFTCTACVTCAHLYACLLTYMALLHGRHPVGATMPVRCLILAFTAHVGVSYATVVSCGACAFASPGRAGLCLHTACLSVAVTMWRRG